MGYADIITVRIDKESSGLFVATSKDMPGLLVAHPDREIVEQDIPNVIRVLIKRRRNQDVLVAKVSPDESQIDRWVFVPAFIAAQTVGATQ